MRKIKLLIISTLIYPLFCFSEHSFATKENMLQDLDVIKTTLEVRYAPKEWKYTLLNWDLNQEIDFAKEKVTIADSITIKDYQKIVRNFFKRMQDYHVNVTFSSTEKAALPLSIQSANGRYFITHVENTFKEKDKTIHVGDEVLAIDGMPVDNCVAELIERELGPSDKLTDKTMAENILTLRLGAIGHDIPKGKIVYTIKNKQTQEITDCELTWKYYPEMIKGDIHSPANQEQHLAIDKDNYLKHPILHKKWSTPLVDTLANAKKQIDLFEKNSNKDEWAHEFIGYKTSKLPRPKNILWTLDKPENEKFYDAYIYRNAKGKKVGFIRIPSYSPAADSESLFEEFDEIINLFESYTDCVVIDQLDNPGGSLFYMFALLSRLTDRPLQLFTDRETITQQDAIDALEMKAQFECEIAFCEKNGIEDDCTQIGGYYLNLKEMKNFCKYFEFLVNEWNSDRVFSNTCHLYGLKEIRPNSYVRYSKPILLLVNELDFSCGDFFPSIMQENKRATLMGRTTAGAGGYVLSNTYYNLFGIRSFSFTGSIAERIDGSKIENIGVTPDISYALTERDLESSYVDFTKAIDDVVNTVLN